MPARDPITCHVLDTTAGRPAAHIITTLMCASNPAVAFTAVTNADGRIATWESEIDHQGNQPSIKTMIKEHAEKEGTAICPKGSSVWRIKFNTGAYYGPGKTFFPEVELTFLVKEGEHFHVPLLLSPYSYTTYRGS
jgi:5-hydroxyisourate hydrolase